LGGAGAGDGVGLVRDHPFITGIFFQRGGFEKNFAGQEFFQLTERA
jgi:hypothetical protein